MGLLQDSGPFCSLDALFISIDLEVSRDERSYLLQSSIYRPLIKEYGVAILDTRDINECTDGSNLRQLISTQHYATRPVGTALPRLDRECIFAPSTTQIRQDKFPAIIAESLRVRDPKSRSRATRFRNIAIVGHSVKHDLRILQRCGIDVLGIAPLVIILDTHSMGRDVLGPTSTRLCGRAPIGSFTLAAVLAELSCHFDEDGLHNAGNDATYTLLALIALAIRSSQARVLQEHELAGLEHLIRITAPVDRGRLLPPDTATRQSPTSSSLG